MQVGSQHFLTKSLSVTTLAFRALSSFDLQPQVYSSEPLGSLCDPGPMLCPCFFPFLVPLPILCNTPTPFIQRTLLSAWKFPTPHSRSCSTSHPGSFPGSHSPVWSDLPISISWCMLHSSRDQTLSDSDLANECQGADIGLILHYNFNQRTRLANRSS